MQAGISDILGKRVGDDPSWAHARRLAEHYVRIPNHVWKLFRNAWYGQSDIKDFFKVMGFARLNPACLVHAADLGGAGDNLSADQVERAIMTMGMRHSSVVLAINQFCRTILSTNPPPNMTQALMQELINRVEIGYRLGSKSFDLGGEVGALVGFATLAGELVLMADEPKKYKTWYQACRSPTPPSRRVTQGVFGCEPFQVSALCIQALGFGAEAAIGVACAGGRLDARGLELHEESVRCMATQYWIEALRDGRSYPAQIEMRNLFREFAPGTGPNQNKNITLEGLHAEVGHVRNTGSQWRWHLP